MKDALVIRNMSYELNDDDEFKGAKFVSIKKVTTSEDGKQRFQNVTVKLQDWISVRTWLMHVLKKSEEEEGKEPEPEPEESYIGSAVDLLK